MKKNKKANVLLFLIIILFVLLVIIITFYSKLLNNEGNDPITDDEIIEEGFIEKEPVVNSPRRVLEKYGSILINRNNNELKVEFAKKLFNEDGSSNENFFKNIIDDMIVVIPKETFVMIDGKNDIVIEVKYNTAREDYKIVINGKDDFYEVTDGLAYVKVEKSKIIENSNIYSKNGFLINLNRSQMFVDNIKDYLKDEKELMNGYYSYNDNKIRIKYAPNKAVFNIIFDKKYQSEILPGVTPSTPLAKIKETYPDNTLGSVEKGYLGYRNSEFYFFFYEDEVSCFGYRYGVNSAFEKYLDEYLKTGDLEKFAVCLKTILSYDEYEFNKDIGKLKVVYPSRGIEIDIIDNDPKGVKLYSNYYFTDYTRSIVKDGKISFSTKDLVEKYEMKRKGLD